MGSTLNSTRIMSMTTTPAKARTNNNLRSGWLSIFSFHSRRNRYRNGLNSCLALAVSGQLPTSRLAGQRACDLDPGAVKFSSNKEWGCALQSSKWNTKWWEE